MNDAAYLKIKAAVLRDLSKRASAERLHAEDAGKPGATQEYKRAVEEALREWRASKGATAAGKQ